MKRRVDGQVGKNRSPRRLTGKRGETLVNNEFALLMGEGCYRGRLTYETKSKEGEGQSVRPYDLLFPARDWRKCILAKALKERLEGGGA